MSRILVTGANGFVGTHLVNELKQDNKVINLVHNGIIGLWQKEVLDDLRVLYSDVRDFLEMKRVMLRYRIDEVYHLAALPIVKVAHKDPISTFEVNLMGTVNVLEAARQADVKRTVIMCTDKVYGDGRDLTEYQPLAKKNEPYAASKVCQAVVAESYMHTYGMNIAMLHSCNIYGYDPFNNRIVPNVVKECIRGINPAIFSNDPSIREYIYVDDVVNALTTLMALKNNTGSHNATTGDVLSQEEMVLKILEFFPELEPVYQAHNLPKQLQEQSLASERWAWKPEWTIEGGLEATIEQFKQFKEDWWKE
jgi:CDP-glucose 4,6-dehydratase